ncbi:MAG: HlyD family secretion protein, partial [Rivularia sp. ALOHA_DT_140]|nr:HlyD family secretion protein [Rivularia sp. ALOHA_DT_140]
MVSNQDFLPPIETNEFLPPISRWATFGGVFILIVLGLSIPIAAVTKYKVTVRGKAVIRPAGELRIVQAATEGQVMRIHVKDNDEVKKGDAIASIDDSRLQTKKSKLQSNIQQSRLQRIQINAQIQALNSQIQAETDRISRTVIAAEAQLRGSSRAYQDKKITAITEIQEADANVNIAKEELRVGKLKLQSAQADFLSTEAALNAARARWNRYQNVGRKGKGALSKNLIDETRLAVEQQEQAVQSRKVAIAEQKRNIERLKQAVKASIARRSRLQTALNPSNAEVVVATERIAQEKAAGKSQSATLEKERQVLINQRIEVEKELKRDTRELKQVENELKYTTITAIADGIISQSKLRNPGQTLRAGEEVVRIVPTNAAKVMKTTVGLADKNKLKIGQKVQMRVIACPYPNYGTLNGKVKGISPDAITPQQNASNAGSASGKVSSFYQVTVEPEKLVLGKGKNQCH